MTGFDTILVSALTSAGVALAIEWTAKPRLEARKERIIAETQARREIINQLSTIVVLGARLNVKWSSLNASERSVEQELFQEHRTEIVTAGEAIANAFPVIATTINARTRYAITFAIGVVCGITKSKELTRQNGERLAEISRLALDLYSLHWWHFRKRRKLLTKSRQFFGDKFPLPPASVG